MLCDVRDLFQRYTYFQGLYEPAESYLFTLLLRPGMTVIDAGANAGQYTLLAATAIAPGGSVHSFEPVPSNFRQLEENIRRNALSNVQAVRAALWSEEGEVILGVPQGQPQDRDNSGRWSVNAISEELPAVTARALRLDTYVKQAGVRRVDMIKMDIEGAEPFLISGARETLAACHPVIVAEVNAQALERLGSSTAKLWEELQTLGYRAWRIGPSLKESGPLTDFGSLEYANVIFHLEDLPEAVTQGWARRTARKWACSGW
jgi:FkbM family methyltransferase